MGQEHSVQKNVLAGYGCLQAGTSMQGKLWAPLRPLRVNQSQLNKDVSSRAMLIMAMRS